MKLKVKLMVLAIVILPFAGSVVTSCIQDIIVSKYKDEIAFQITITNPANGQATVKYKLEEHAKVEMVIYDANPKLVEPVNKESCACILVDEQQLQGDHMETWNGLLSTGEQAVDGTYVLWYDVEYESNDPAIIRGVSGKKTFRYYAQ